jgi:mono/diheme cytochrome c family protein
MRRSMLWMLLFLGQSLAEDGAAIYKSKCASCHGPTGSGRTAIKGSNLLTAEAKKRSDAELADAIAKGGEKKNSSHAYEKKGLSVEQVNMVVGHIRKLQKQSE